MIPYGRQDITEDDIDAVVSVLKSDFLTQGPKVPEFEKQIADYIEASHVLAMNSATSALHISCLALGLGQGDWLWTTPITFAASANCALYCGAQVDFVDIDPHTYNMCPLALEDKLIQAEKVGRLPKIIVPVHLSGQSCDMVAIFKLSKKYGFKIIEDASHAIGGRYLDQAIGGCQYSDITVFSFHPVKIITTAEGGVAATNDAAVAKKIELLRSHGITRDLDQMTETSHGEWFYQQIELGFNYRMTDIQACLGTSQIQRLDDYIRSRHTIAEKYARLLEQLPLTTPFQHQDTYSAYHLYIIRLDLPNCRYSHKEIFSHLRSNGIGVNLHYIPIYKHPYYRQFGYAPNDFPNSERYYSEAISLPMYPGLTGIQQNKVVQTLNQILVS